MDLRQPHFLDGRCSPGGGCVIGIGLFAAGNLSIYDFRRIKRPVGSGCISEPHHVSICIPYRHGRLGNGHPEFAERIRPARIHVGPVQFIGNSFFVRRHLPPGDEVGAGALSQSGGSSRGGCAGGRRAPGACPDTGHVPAGDAVHLRPVIHRPRRAPGGSIDGPGTCGCRYCAD